MQVTVFGANGKVGRLVVEEALRRGHKVTAFVHHPSKHPKNKNLKIIQGSVRNAGSIAKAIKNSDAVISALGSWGTQKKDIQIVGMQNLIPAMQKAGIERIISLTGHGASAKGDSFDPVHEFSRWIMLLFAKKILVDGEEHIRLLEKSKLKWTVLRSPVMNTLGSSDFLLSNKRPAVWKTINRQSVALCMVELAESEEYSRKSPFIIRA